MVQIAPLVGGRGGRKDLHSPRLGLESPELRLGDRFSWTYLLI